METQQNTVKYSSLPIRIDTLNITDDRSVFILRDDLLPGGSKQRAVLPMLKELKNLGVTAVTYASPFAGFAQVALAQGCQEIGLRCDLFAEFDKTKSQPTAHAFTNLAIDYGAQVELVETLAAGELRAEKQALAVNTYKLPLGFQCELFKKYFRQAIADVLETAKKKLQSYPERIWLPVGSATLSSTVHEALRGGCELHCVNVQVLSEEDTRIQNLISLPGVHYYKANQPFSEPCDHLPPIPSNVHYDAKLWRLIKTHGQNGDLWWNVAR